jgi:2-(1,2-epoxy-1,2-dihydrophenyl)acetyl-CoA isomerase
MSDDILFEVDDKVATITLNRPEKRNAFTLEMIDAWAEALETCHAHDDVHVVVLTGKGRAFCSGGDIGGLLKGRATKSALERKNELTQHVHRIPLLLERMDKPVLVAVNGAAAGAGLDMALMGDIRYAAESARLGESYVKMGIVPGDGGAYYLPRLIGLARALEMLLTGDFIDAREAERIGLVNKVLPDEELMPYTYGVARKIAQGPTLAIRMIKRAVYQGLQSDLRASLDLISSHYGIVASGDDHAEAVDAFLEKREPEFKGR